MASEPMFRPRPSRLRRYHRFSSGQFDVFVHEEKVLESIAQRARLSREAEIVGRLVGRPYRDDRGDWAVVTGEIAALGASGPADVRTTTEDAGRTSLSLEQDFPTEELVGWYHSHVGGLHDYSSTDRMNQAGRKKPYHIGLLSVVSDNSVSIHAFRGPECERLRDSFNCKAASLLQRYEPSTPACYPVSEESSPRPLRGH